MDVKDKISLLPHQPGVYQFLNDKGVIIYVGKAKDLRRRVSSYFVASHQAASRKLALLVRNIVDIRHIVVDTEADALLLENNLIKQYQPRYNILLKDGKSYPWICIKSERFPRVFSTRNLVKDGSQYFGPYASVTMQRTVLDLAKHLYPLRSCKLALTAESVAAGKYAVCLEYHIGNCKAPCVGRQTEEEYNANIAMVRDILRGNLREVSEYIKAKMEEAADCLQYEEAAMYKDKLALLEHYQSKSVIVSPTLSNLDVVNLLPDDATTYCSYMSVVGGAIVRSYTFELRSHLDETSAELLAFALGRIENKAREIIVPFMPETAGMEHITFTVPQRGDKLKLLEMAERNCKFFRIEKLKQIEHTDPDRHTNRILTRMQKDLHLSDLPTHIECFDNSNIQGTNPVASCVVFRDAKPARRDYRHFNIKTVIGANDFASMQEVIGRRYRRLQEEGEPLPQIIVVDGGKGQLSSAYATLKEMGLEGKIAIIGLAKRLEEVYFPEDPVPHYLDKNSETLKVLMQIRDEAHRFGINFHRQKRSINFIKSELEQIPALGAKSVEKLLKKYKTISRIRKASAEELTEILGRNRAESLAAYFSDKGEG